MNHVKFPSNDSARIGPTNSLSQQCRHKHNFGVLIGNRLDSHAVKYTQSRYRRGELAQVAKRLYQPRGSRSVRSQSAILQRFRIERITKVVEKFVLCGDSPRASPASSALL